MLLVGRLAAEAEARGGGGGGDGSQITTGAQKGRGEKSPFRRMGKRQQKKKKKRKNTFPFIFCKKNISFLGEN